jgi:hypothetical protein
MKSDVWDNAIDSIRFHQVSDSMNNVLQAINHIDVLVPMCSSSGRYQKVYQKVPIFQEGIIVPIFQCIIVPILYYIIYSILSMSLPQLMSMGVQV